MAVAEKFEACACMPGGAGDSQSGYLRNWLPIRSANLTMSRWAKGSYGV
jgi:hypothetical protein